MKIKWLLILLVLLLTACSNNVATSDGETQDIPDVVFDAESLAEFNGKDDQPAYVAVDGIVYDVTDVKAWQSPHAGQFEPGKDYSKEILESPHGKKNLEGLTIVGRYEE